MIMRNITFITYSFPSVELLEWKGACQIGTPSIHHHFNDALLCHCQSCIIFNIINGLSRFIYSIMRNLKIITMQFSPLTCFALCKICRWCVIRGACTFTTSTVCQWNLTAIILYCTHHIYFFWSKGVKFEQIL